MNTLIRSWQRVLFAFAVVIFVSVSVGTTLASVNTTLLSEDFSEGYVPPDGWSSDNYYYGYSYYSSAGNGGYNGSWVFDMYDCDYDRIYSPTVDLSGYMNAGDMVTVSFDVYMEFNSNDQFYQSIFGEGGAQFQVFADDGEGAFWSNQPMLDLSYTSDYYTY